VTAGSTVGFPDAGETVVAVEVAVDDRFVDGDERGELVGLSDAAPEC
jgi:hypothetical protein